MSNLPSGLPELIADGESLARFLTSSSWFARTSGRIKLSVFLPAPDNDTSVFRSSDLSDAQLWEHSALHFTDQHGIPRRHHGAALVFAGDVRATGIDSIAQEPPPRHANLRGWPIDDDPDQQKAKRKRIAAEIAEEAELLLRDPTA